ncbi:AAA family ATPase [Streptomyces sp. ISL-96]|uniref:helix-turn-helix transcriptional regulator n=1 Tax=Streptomyces sp. ISL-96 TaxID=2819191 RepID=UPI001BE559A0|nr:LuxR family transcriptional regulator [Streptomyces sp. ISL-96]MBT2492700.1 AAA family ATPase [Streptomyces sp. ISL-96]
MDKRVAHAPDASAEGAGRLVGRGREQAVLHEAIARLKDGEGGLYLVEGDTGVGKTTLVESVLRSADVADVSVLRGGARGGAVPYGPLMAALRDQLWDQLRDQHPRRSGGEAADEGNEGMEDVPSAMKRAFERLARRRPTVVFLDDLQWADAATLTVLADWVAPVPGVPLLVIGAYRSDELPRQHPVRSLRSGLRRAPGGRQWHVRLGPLGREDSAVCVRRLLGDGVAPEVLDTVVRRAHGLPFYLEELAAAVTEAGEASPDRVVPESVRDAVLQRVARLSEPARAVAELAAVAATVHLDVLAEVLAELGTEEAVEELFESGVLVEVPDPVGGAEEAAGKAAFRHALVGEALYAAIPWARRRRLHAVLAQALEVRGEAPAVVAAHWDKAHEPARARPPLLAAAEAACRVHAYRDARNAIDRALVLWPPGEKEAARVQVVDRLGECAERCGDLAEAARAWEEVAAAHRAAGDHEALARTERSLAGVYELADDWPRALGARYLAVEEFARAGLPTEAATERLAAAAHLQYAGDLTAALRLVREARAEVETEAAAHDVTALRARATGLEGLIRTKLGDGVAGTELTREALDLALSSELDALTAEVYYLHADALEQRTDYPAALDAWADALTFCRSRGLDADAHVCLACLAPALRHTGQWDRALEVGHEVLATDDAPEVAHMVAAGEIGLILANRGTTAQARRHLIRAAAFSQTHELFGLEIDTSWGLARADDLDGQDDSAVTRLRELNARCRIREELHYSVAALRWSSSYFGRRGLRGDLGACTDTLARIAAATGTAEATGALAHALGESALLEEDPCRAADQFERALALLGAVALPPETAETQVRAGVALAAAGDRGKAVERLVPAYHTARALGARPLAAAALRELEALGEDVRRRLGRRAARHSDPAGLTSREREVLRLVAAGLTNSEIAGGLFLSPRTVDMHVRNLLAKLGCHTRTEAARRAGELALLETIA